MAISPTANRISTARLAQFGPQLRELRQRMNDALIDDWENPQAAIDFEDLQWLANLPRGLPRGSILNGGV